MKIITQKVKQNLLQFFLLVTIFTTSGCSDEVPVEQSWGKMQGLESIVGNMQDESYSSAKDITRYNALDEPMTLAELAGDFVWVEYAAPWCSACPWQTNETKKAEQILQGQVIFMTTLTSNSEKYNDHATVKTAKNWAKRFKLNPEHVVAAELWYKTVPEHRLFSPHGQTLFVHVGSLSAKEIRQTISYYKTDWEMWNNSGQTARWMKP